MNTLSALLFEDTPKPEAPEDEIFGQYLFPDFRNLLAKGVKEPNTPPEDKFRVALQYFMSSNETDQLKPWMATIERLMAEHEYEPVLEPGSRTVYRGLQLANLVETLKSWGVTKKVLDQPPGPNKIPKYHTFKHAFTLRPINNRVFQSWSSDKKMAASFADVNGLYGPEEQGAGVNLVVVQSHTKKGVFFGKPGDLAVAANTGWPEEKETISIGDVPCTVFYLGYNEDLTSLKARLP